MYQLWPGDAFTPAVYNTMSESCTIIMEDLLKEGFVSKYVITQLDFEHCTLALQTLAEFHAVSYMYLQSKNPGDKTKCMRYVGDLGSPLRRNVDSVYDKFLQTVSSLQHYSKIKELRDFKANFWEYWKTMMTLPNEEGVNVLVHGDLHPGNILFKYCDRKQLIASKMVDW